MSKIVTVVIEGEAGAGKTRVANELLKVLKKAGFSVVYHEADHLMESHRGPTDRAVFIKVRQPGVKRKP